MRILLTGASGMVGRNLLEQPAAARHELLLPSRAELDLGDYNAVARWFELHAPELVVHAAGLVGGIQANMQAPVSFLLANLDMGRNVVLAARHAGVKRLINLGSSCMYPRNVPNPLCEESVLAGQLEPSNEAYALAKVVVARLCDYLHREDPSLEYKTLIPCNLYGRYDKFDPQSSHMLPAILHKLHHAKLNGESEVVIWGNGQARREFMYAADLADCIWRAIDHFDTLPPTMNVGLGYDCAVNEYYQLAASIVGFEGLFIHDLSKPVGMQQKQVSIEKQLAWGWQASTSLAAGMSLTYQYYLEEGIR